MKIKIAKDQLEALKRLSHCCHKDQKTRLALTRIWVHKGRAYATDGHVARWEDMDLGITEDIQVSQDMLKVASVTLELDYDTGLSLAKADQYPNILNVIPKDIDLSPANCAFVCLACDTMTQLIKSYPKRANLQFRARPSPLAGIPIVSMGRGDGDGLRFDGVIMPVHIASRDVASNPFGEDSPSHLPA